MSLTAETHDTGATVDVTRSGSGSNRRPVIGLSLVLGSTVLFGFGAIASKVVLDAGIPAARLAAMRATGAAAILLVVILATDRRRLRLPRRDIPAIIALGLAGAALIQWLYFVAIDRLPVGIGVLLEFTAPLLVALYSWLVLAHVLGRRVWLALALALTGLAMVSEVWSGGALDAVGVAAALAAAVCLAAFYLLSGSVVERLHPTTLVLWMFVTASVFWAVVQPWWQFDASALGDRVRLPGALDGVTLPLWTCVGWVVVLGTLVPYALEIVALRHLSPTRTGVVSMSEPLFAAGFAWWLLDQGLGAIQILGAAVLLSGVVLSELSSTSASAALADAPVLSTT